MSRFEQGNRDERKNGCECLQVLIFKDQDLEAAQIGFRFIFCKMFKADSILSCSIPLLPPINPEMGDPAFT
ncbi:hypothetical protein Nepgr_002360 [Nepenthes gracilis]|uniref:Uncharacterized protein n=1 Tax=Nepenthes gracilis TaxID=150966 RepID=A0AAD3P644_NEPGR|nr:hypothetical protein Nepgr_002360 [Nepenthes gracilis]